MIPEFNENGNLPPGIHDAAIKEVEERFGKHPTRRRIQFAFLLDAIAILKAAGCTALYLDGSFVTNKELPGDFDALVISGEGGDAIIDLMEPPPLAVAKKYAGEFYYTEALAYDQYRKKRIPFLELFQTEKLTGIAKGIIKIDLA